MRNLLDLIVVADCNCTKKSCHLCFPAETPICDHCEQRLQRLVGDEYVPTGWCRALGDPCGAADCKADEVREQLCIECDAPVTYDSRLGIWFHLNKADGADCDGDGGDPVVPLCADCIDRAPQGGIDFAWRKCEAGETCGASDCQPVPSWMDVMPAIPLAR